MNVIVFDLETRESPPEVGWKNFAAQQISYGCAWLSSCDEFRLYGEDTIHKLAEDLHAADCIVGFNVLDFDLPLLKATLERVTDGRASLDIEAMRPKVYDILADIRKALGTQFAKGWKLDQVAESNLTCKKNGDGAMAPELWKAGRHAELCTYVLQDVKVERELWRHVLEHGMVRNKFAQPAELKLSGIHWRTGSRDLAPA